jgi:hypothetical protein
VIARKKFFHVISCWCSGCCCCLEGKYGILFFGFGKYSFLSFEPNFVKEFQKVVCLFMFFFFFEEMPEYRAFHKCISKFHKIFLKV